jgi:type I restriction enzyme S subunit
MRISQTKEPWIGEMPAEWRLTAIKRLVSTKITDGPHETPELAQDGVPFISAEAIKNNQIDFNLRRGFISPELHEQYSRKCTPQKGDIFVIKSGATTGNVAYVDVDFEFSIWSPLALIRCDERIAFYKFVYYVFLTDVFRKQVELSWSFGTQQNIGMAVIERLKIPIPPIGEQKRIAAFLDASCAAIDAAVAAKRRQLEIFDELRKNTLHAAFANERWPVERLKDVATKIGSGITPEGGAAGYLDEGIPLLRSQNVHFDGLRLDDVAFISEDTHAEMSSSKLKPRDVLLNITGASIGRCTFVPENFRHGNVNQHVCFIRVNHQLDYRFLASFLSSPLGQGQVFSSFTGASRQGLSHKELGLICIPLPSLSVQRDVVSVIEEHDAKQKRVRSSIESQIATLTAYRKSLIHECVTGQCRIRDADVQRAAVQREFDNP